MTATKPEPAVGMLPPRLMAMLQRHTDAALTPYGTKTAGAGGLILFNVVRGMLTELGELPEPTTDYGELSTRLAYQVQAALIRFRDLDAGHEIPAEAWAAMPDLARTLREAAAQIDHVVSLYNEGNPSY